MKSILNTTQFIRVFVLLSLGFAVVGCIPRAPTDAETAYQDSRMSPSVTYVHLLRHTPFFAELNDEQLKWVTQHSREWEAPKGTVIYNRAPGVTPSSDIWVLLDGNWQVEAQSSTYSAGNAAPGKWYSAAATYLENRLVTTSRSYVMRIKAVDMEEMLARGFPFESHLAEGRRWYAHIDTNKSNAR